MRLLYNLRDHRSNNSSNGYNRHEQNQAISSAETQVSIANEIMKSATSGLSVRANALVTAADNYVSQMNKITSRALRSSSSNRLLRAHDSKASGREATSSYSDASSVSKAPESSASVGKVLVSLKSNVGTIYSLVNDRNSSSRN